MTKSTKRRGAPEPGDARQPRYEQLVTSGPTGFALVTRGPNGRRIEVPLGRVRGDSR